MRTYTRNKATGNDSATDFANQVRDVIYKELQIRGSSTIKVHRRTNGIILSAKPGAGNATSSSSSVWI